MNSGEHKEWERTMPKEFGASLEQIRNARAPLDSIQRSLTAAENISMTSAAWQRGIKNAFLCAVLLYSIVGLAIWATVWFTKSSLILVVLSITGIAWLIALIACLLSWVWGLRRLANDTLLLDCGPHPARRLFQVNAGIFSVAGLCTVIVGEGWIAGGVAAFQISCVAYWLMVSTGRLRFYRSGIWTYWGLLRWEKIKSVRWEGKHDATLLIQTSGRLPLLSRGALPIAVEQKEAVQQLIQQYITFPE